MIKARPPTVAAQMATTLMVLSPATKRVSLRVAGHDRDPACWISCVIVLVLHSPTGTAGYGDYDRRGAIGTLLA